MLTRPVHGWSEFQLEGTSVYELSYLDDIAFEWVEQAIHGLETLLPFCVKGFLEPNRFLCTVSYWNCHIICEDEDSDPLDPEDMTYEFSHTNMLQFCQFLYEDIRQNLEEWVTFVDYREINTDKRRKVLTERLKRLKELISERESCFDGSGCFL